MVNIIEIWNMNSASVWDSEKDDLTYTLRVILCIPFYITITQKKKILTRSTAEDSPSTSQY